MLPFWGESGFPLGLENLGKMGKSGNFEQTGKVRENETKYLKTEGISDKWHSLFLVIFQ